MSKTRALIEAIEDCRNELDEARRYVRQRPEDADAQIERFAEKLLPLCRQSLRVLGLSMRLSGNFEAGQRCKMAAPYVLEGYIDGALWELAWIKSEIEKELTPS